MTVVILGLYTHVIIMIVQRLQFLCIAHSFSNALWQKSKKFVLIMIVLYTT